RCRAHPRGGRPRLVVPRPSREPGGPDDRPPGGVIAREGSPFWSGAIALGWPGRPSPGGTAFVACDPSCSAPFSLCPSCSAARAAPPEASSTPALCQPPPATGDHQHDFDFEFGRWTAKLSRRLRPLTGSNEWVAYEGTSVVHPLWQGRSNIGELDVTGPAGHIE